MLFEVLEIFVSAEKFEASKNCLAANIINAAFRDKSRRYLFYCAMKSQVDWYRIFRID